MPGLLERWMNPAAHRTSGARAAVTALNRGPLSMSANANPDFMLPKLSSLSLVILQNVLLQISFFIIVSSSNDYAKYLGGNSTFSGVVIGIPTVFSAMALPPLRKLDKGGYKLPMHVSCASMVLGLVLYSLAYYTNFLYLILIGRCVNGFGFTSFMYSKKYCSDPRIVGIRQRTTLASWLVIGQGIGLSLGPFAGGLFYKVGFKNAIFNGYTSPTWIMAGIWCLFWICATLWFEDPPAEQEDHSMHTISTAPSTVQPEPESGIQVIARNDLSALHMNVSTSLSIAKSHTGGSLPDSTSLHAHSTSSPPAIPTSPIHQAPLHLRLLRRLGMTSSQLGVTICMCWFAMTCFFILGAWEANLPVFGAFFPKFHWSPYAAGNFIALGGITTFPFLVANIFLARRLQDRHLLAFGTGLGTIALFIFLSLLRADKVNYASAFICWWAVALGFNLATTVTMSLLSKQLPPSWNAWASMMIQYSNYMGRVTGAIWGGSGVTVGMMNYVGLEIAIVGIGVLLFTSLWKELKAKTG